LGEFCVVQALRISRKLSRKMKFFMGVVIR